MFPAVAVTNGARRGAASWSRSPRSLAIYAAVLMGIMAVLYFLRSALSSGAGSSCSQTILHPATPLATLVSYAYYEKDDIQRANFEFFLEAGTRPPAGNQAMHFVFVVAQGPCSPCKALDALPPQREEPALKALGLVSAVGNASMVLLKRSDNEGQDFGSHNVTLSYLRLRRQFQRYAYFFFLNSSVKGPFLPSYIPPTWHWSHAYMGRFTGNIHAVGSSLVCLPDVDAGGPGPRLESWAIALDQKGISAAIEDGVFAVRTCKLCTSAAEGVVVGGEYGMTLALLKRGYNVATLMSRYARDINWAEPKHWGCNDNVHPSRHGTYGGIAFHPYETVFVKSSWHVADPYTKAYGQWALQHLHGQAGTDGNFDEPMYRHAITAQAQDPNGLAAAYQVGPRLAHAAAKG